MLSSVCSTPAISGGYFFRDMNAFLGIRIIIPLDISSPQKQDIAKTKFHPLILGDFVQTSSTNSMGWSAACVIVVAVFHSPRTESTHV
jgi:hypothetical protein